MTTEIVSIIGRFSAGELTQEEAINLLEEHDKMNKKKEVPLMNKKELIKEISTLDKSLIDRLGISMLKDYKGWKKSPLHILIMLRDKIVDLTNK